MDINPMEERDTVIIDIESCVYSGKGDGAGEEIAEIKAKDMPLMASINALEVSNESVKSKAKKHSMSAKHKKPPRPPPRGLSLDAADQKLIKEIAELAMIKRARIERMKALKKMKAAKASSSSSSSSSGNLLAILFSIAFFVLFILQGCHSSVRHRSVASSPLKSNRLQAQYDIYDAVPDRWTLSTNGVPLTSVEYDVMKLDPGSDSANERREAASIR